ncbi:MAG: DegV family EDD domain-containing protein [Oscillibacter sp.]|nr:DegV family EDD domain-containing protein [Oscillibacter sp.]
MWNIVSDSSCDLRTDEFSSDCVRFESVPLRIRVGEREFLDNDGLRTADLIHAMREEKGPSSTACPSPAAYARAFEKGTHTVCFTISGNLSGSYNAAVSGRNLFLEEHPDRKVCVINSKSTAGVPFLLIRRAKERMEADPEGEHFEEICDELRTYQASLRTCFTLENFDNLIKNGRMRPLVGTLLHTLGIHVVAIGTTQGSIQVVSKARGEAKTHKVMADIMSASKDCTGASVMIHHCENLAGAVKLKEVILKELPVKSVEIIPCRGLNSFYAMEKGLIVGY